MSDWKVKIEYKNKDLETVVEKEYEFIDYTEMLCRELKRVLNDIEDAFAKYGKAIKYNDETHNQIIENIKAGIERGYNFTTLDDFICDRGWLALDAYLKGDGININTEAIKMI